MAAHPLTRPASWALTRGAPDTRLIRWAATAVWMAAAVVGVVWLLGVTQDALDGHVSLVYLLLAWPAMLAWLLLAWRIWRRWMAGGGGVTLQWRGPVTRESGGASPLLGGFYVAEWDEPVRVRVALSWQGWMLLALVRAPGPHGDAPLYAWLDGREVEDPHATAHNRSLHQLRTLLHLPSAVTTQVGEPLQDAAQLGASWTHSLNPGSMLRRLASSFSAATRVGHLPEPTDSAVPSTADTAFPATTVMVDQRAPQQAARARQGGRR